MYEIDPDGCWIWDRYINSNGYGQLYVYGESKKAHRFAWELFKGRIPKGNTILHTCDILRCVNPDHLYADNKMRRKQDGNGK